MILGLNIVSGVLCALVVLLATVRGVRAELADGGDAPAPRQRASGTLLTVLSVALLLFLALRVYVELS